MRQVQVLSGLALVICFALVSCTPSASKTESEVITAESFEFPPAEFKKVTLDPVHKEVDSNELTVFPFVDEDADANGPVGGQTNSAVRGPDGQVWFATWSGVSRFDGEAWSNQEVLEGEGFGVDALTVAPDGSLIASSWGHVFQYVDGEWLESWPEASKFSGYVVYWPIAVGPDEELWLGSLVYEYEGVFHLDGEKITIYREDRIVEIPNVTEDDMADSTKVTEGSFLPGSIAFSIAVDPDGAAWFTTFDGLVRYDGTEWASISGEEYFSGEPRSIASGPDGSLWVYSSEGFSHFDGQVWTNYTLADSPGASVGDADDYGAVPYIAFAPDGDAWFTGPQGPYLFDGEQVTAYMLDIDGYREHDSILGTPIAVDGDGALWLGIGYEGIYRFMPAAQ